MQIVVSLVQALAWPVVALAVLFVLRREFKQFLSKVGQLQLKAGAFEATATAQQELQAAASLGAATARAAVDQTTPQSPQAFQSHAEEIAKVVSRAAEAAPGQLAGAQVLWVDDNPDNNVYERQSLESLGLRFTLSRSTDDALERLRSQRFDVIISDMGRPPDPKAGYTLLTKIKDMGITTPFIIYAGSASPEHKAEATQKGAIGTTNRPQDLFRLVIDSVTRRSSQGSGLS